MNENFARIDRLPTYVFAITNELKAKARSEGEDIIDFGMGNPDQPRFFKTDFNSVKYLASFACLIL